MASRAVDGVRGGRVGATRRRARMTSDVGTGARD